MNNPAEVEEEEAVARMLAQEAEMDATAMSAAAMKAASVGVSGEAGAPAAAGEHCVRVWVVYSVRPRKV